MIVIMKDPLPLKNLEHLDVYYSIWRFITALLVPQTKLNLNLQLKWTKIYIFLI